MSKAVERYLSRDLRLPSHIAKRGIEDAHLWCVIPACDELEFLPSTLDSLREVEDMGMVVVVNDPPAAPDALIQRNRELIEYLLAREEPMWIVDASGPERQLSRGVGEARRIGFDLVMKLAASRPEVLIASLDADSPVADTWATAMHDARRSALSVRAFFEHPLESRYGRSVATYELWHRYLGEGMRRAGSPYAYDVLGSAFAVTPHDYAVARGIPLRSATEDFHFVNKVTKNLGHPLPVIPGARVYPSGRISERVPLGTGPAVAAIEDGDTRYRIVEDPAAFEDVARVYHSVDALWEHGARAVKWTGPALEFWSSDGWDERIGSLRASATSFETFRRSLFVWFDALRSLRLFNHVADRFERVPILDAVRAVSGIEAGSVESALRRFRAARLEALRHAQGSEV